MGIFLGSILLTVGLAVYFESKYQNLVYPGITVGGLDASGKTKKEIGEYFTKKSFPYQQIVITFAYEDTVATISGEELNLSLDGKLSAEQAYSLGRSGHFLGDTYQKFNALKNGTRLPVVLHIETSVIDDFFTNLSDRITIEPEDALFKFESGRVTAFKLSNPGRRLNVKKAKLLLVEYLRSVSSSSDIENPQVMFTLPVEIVNPTIATSDTNKFGIQELIGRGSSKFAHSIPGRIHNISLAASRIHGRLIPPGGVFSFNEGLGDVSAATGFQPAYIIKSGKTILGDGGGVCQVSTTLFRAALNAGLPIVERWAHAYRVGYYEQDSKPGLDATVYAPTVDLKIKNDTGSYILIQAITNTINASLAFELYGTKDDRVVSLSTPKMYSQAPPPPDLYQDDPTLPAGEVKQTDFAAWGAKVDFTYKVTRDGETLFEKNFFSNYRPWQAVFLKGTKT